MTRPYGVSLTTLLSGAASKSIDSARDVPTWLRRQTGFMSSKPKKVVKKRKR